MVKKRLIFTLLYMQEHFMLSRNFRLQKVGNLEWLQSNYDFSHISHSIDELMVLDVTRGEKATEKFSAVLKVLAEGCFVPIAAGGGVRSVRHASALLRSGADKVVINTPLYEGKALADDLAKEFGQQCVVASMDIKRGPDNMYQAWSECGGRCVTGSAAEWIQKVCNGSVGEVYLNSMDRDGTGQGYDLQLLDILPPDMHLPVILAGGVGNSRHLAEGLAEERVDAVATAHLFNFVGDGLMSARRALVAAGVALPCWDASLYEQLWQQCRAS
jgi:cyclase